jgi:hypothetical protein
MAGQTRPANSRCRFIKGWQRLKTTTGASLSEVLNEKVTSGEENGFSRRRVVKGVAWTVPVIATAIAAPAAAASGNMEALLDYATGEIATFVQAGSESVSGQNRSGKGPVAFHVKNSSGAASGAITGTITIASAVTTDPRVGVNTFSGGTLTEKTPTTSPTFSAKFSLGAGVGNGATVSFPLGFYYTGQKNLAKGKEFNLTVSFTSPAGLPTLATILTLS